MFRVFPPFVILCVLLPLISGCEKKPSTPWKNAGFAEHIAADTEGYFSLRHPIGHLRDIRSTWETLLADPAFGASWRESSWGKAVEMIAGSEPLLALGKTFAAIGDDEYFLALGRGSGDRLASARQMRQLFEAARLRNFFTPPVAEDAPSELAKNAAATPSELAAFTEVAVPLSPDMEKALQKFVRDFSMPSILLGAKLRDNAEPSQNFLKMWADGLPEKFPREKFSLSPHGEFTRVRIQIAHLLPPGEAKRGRDALAAIIGDPYVATDLLRALISKPVVISFGRAFGYFLVSIGPDETFPALAENFESSLAALPMLAPLAAHTDDKTSVLFYADTLVTGLAAFRPPVGEYIDAAVESAQEFAPDDRVKSLRAAAASLRHQAEELFQPDVAATCGVITRREAGWSVDVFGGPLAPRLARENGYLPLTDSGQALLWSERWQDGYTERLLHFVGELTAFASDWADGAGSLLLNPKKRIWLEEFLSTVNAPPIRLVDREPSIWNDAFDSDRTLVLDAAAASSPHVAVMVGLRNRGALGKKWATLSKGVWEPFRSTSPSDDVALHELFPPRPGAPDLNPTVAIGNRRWILSSSAALARFLVSTPPSSHKANGIQHIQIETPPLAAFANARADALEAESSLSALDWLPASPQAWRAASALLREGGRWIRCEARWEDDTLHRTITLTAAP